MKYYRNSDSTKCVASNPSLSTAEPKALDNPLYNPVFVYDEIDAMKLKPPETHSDVKNQWRPPFEEIPNQHDNEIHNTDIINPEVNTAPPAHPVRTIRSSSSPPSPVQDTRRPSTIVAPQITSL